MSGRILLVPGGGSSAYGYYGDAERVLESAATVIRVDPPGFDPAGGRVWLPLSEHARVLADALRRAGGRAAAVVGHSLGGLVAIRLALDEPELVAGLVLLDPSPPLFPILLPRPALAGIGRTRQVAAAIARLRRPPRELAGSVPRAVPLAVRVRWYLVTGAVALAADLAARPIPAPVLVVSAGEHGRTSSHRRAHQRLASWMPDGRIEVWPETTHPLHTEQPGRVADAALALLQVTLRRSR